MLSEIVKRLKHTAGRKDQALLIRAAMSNVRILNPDLEYMFLDYREREKHFEGVFLRNAGVLGAFQSGLQRFIIFRYQADYHCDELNLDPNLFLVSASQALLDLRWVFFS